MGRVALVSLVVFWQLSHSAHEGGTCCFCMACMVFSAAAALQHTKFGLVALVFSWVYGCIALQHTILEHVALVVFAWFVRLSDCSTWKWDMSLVY